jgi:uroporphyrinogen decarboxylase
MSTQTDYRLLPTAEKEAIVARFEQRVSHAQAASAPTKDWVKSAIHRQGSGRCPVRIKRLSLDVVLRYGDALADLFCEYPDDVVAIIPYDISIGYQLPGKQPRINPVDVLTLDAQWIDEWGTRWGHAFGGCGATPVDCPLKDWSALEDYLARGIPSPRAPGRLDSAVKLLEVHAATKYCIGVIHLALFERLHAIRGMENVFVDFYEHEDGVRRLLDAIGDYLVDLIRYWAEIGADALFLTDDWGSQTSLMISPAMWRKFFKPRYARVFAQAHRLGMDVIFHSCGNVTAIVDDLIEAGMDVLDPVQPGAMDIDEVARRFGGRCSFAAAVDVQHLLSHGSPQEVRDAVRRVKDTLGRPFGGGLLVGPANVITPEIPFANLQALFEVAHEH